MSAGRCYERLYVTLTGSAPDPSGAQAKRTLQIRRGNRRGVGGGGGGGGRGGDKERDIERGRVTERGRKQSGGGRVP